MHLSLPAYLRLRRTSTRLYKLLPMIPTLTFDAYKRSTQILGNRLRNAHLMRLDLRELNDPSFLFLAKSIHAAEVIRCISSHKSHMISAQAREEAYKIVIYRDGDPEIIVALLNDGKIGESISDLDWNSVFIWASWKGSLKLVKILLENPKVDPKTIDFEGNQSIHSAAYHMHSEVLKLLLNDTRVDHAALGFENRTIIHFAAKNDNPNLIKYLLKNARVDPSKIDIYGNSALHLASEYGNVGVVEVLLGDLRVDPNPINNKGQTPLNSATRSQNLECVKLLLKSPLINARIPDNDGYQPIHIACKFGYLDIVELFLTASNGILVDELTKLEGYDLAVEWQREDVVVRLLKDSKIKKRVEGGSSILDLDFI